MYNRTLCILDWDDTMFPSSWIMNNNIDLLNHDNHTNYLVMFAELDNILYDFLSKCSQMGTVIIVTNASINWIRISLNVLPHTAKFINNKVRVFSARDTYQYNKKMDMWKKLAFEHEIMNHFTGKHDLHNIISIGDAHYEYDALVRICDWKKIIPKKRFLKTIKLMQTPTFYSLIDQINVLSDNIEKICNTKKHVDLHFTPITNYSNKKV